MTDRSVQAFVERVALGFKPDPIKEPTTAILAVFDLLSEKVPVRKMKDRRRALPEEGQRMDVDRSVALRGSAP